MRCSLVLTALACITFCYGAQDRPQSPPITHPSAKEAALGAQLAAQVHRDSTPLGLVGVDNYVKTLGHRLAAQMPHAPEDWKFSVIRDHENESTYEPLALPGGWIFIPANLRQYKGGDSKFIHTRLASNESFRAIQDEVRREVTRTSTAKEAYRIPSLLHPDRR